MSAGTFKQDGLGWRISLIQRRVGEWLEYKTSEIDVDPEGWDWSWLKSKLLWQTLKFLMWSLIAIIAVWLLWQLWLLLRPYWKRWQRQGNSLNQNIPPVIIPQFSQSEWLERSQSARVEGNYHQAIICLYQAMLQLLDERGIIPNQLSRTDEEYRSSLSKEKLAASQAYDLLLSIHQQLCFSKTEADKSLYERCHQAYQQIKT